MKAKRIKRVVLFNGVVMLVAILGLVGAQVAHHSVREHQASLEQDLARHIAHASEVDLIRAFSGLITLMKSILGIAALVLFCNVIDLLPCTGWNARRKPGDDYTEQQVGQVSSETTVSDEPST